MIRQFMPVLIMTAGIIANLWALPAFPGAVGWGGEVTGGRGGQVIHVTNTNAYGAGSLAAACGTSGPKIIVFDVSGTISVGQQLTLNSNTTIAGQTSPNGITIINGALYADNAANIIVRHMRVRRSPDAPDGDCYRFSHCHDIMVDHCTGMWCSDEILDCSYSTYNMTFQNMIIASPLQCFEHYGSGSGYGNNRTGILAVGTDGRFTFYRCLFAHHMKRTPYLSNDLSGSNTGKTFELINNVFYNCMQGGDESFNNNNIPLNLIGNYYMPGPNAAYPVNPYAHTGSVNPAIMIAHSSLNYHVQYPALTNQRAFFNYLSVIGGMNGFAATPIQPVKSPADVPAQTIYPQVCAQVGAFPRDSADSRVLREVQNFGGVWEPDCDPTPDPYLPSGGTPPTDTDRDGMPDTWETAHGLNPGSAADRTTDLGGANAGYNAVEVYINELADLKTPSKTEGRPWHDIANGLDNMIHVTPNPFTETARIRLNAGEIQGAAVIRIFDMGGRLVRTLDAKKASKEGVSWNAAECPAGVYLAQCLVKGRTYSQRMLRVK